MIIIMNIDGYSRFYKQIFCKYTSVGNHTYPTHIDRSVPYNSIVTFSFLLVLSNAKVVVNS